MVKEFVNRVIMILGILILLNIGIAVVIKTYDVEKVKIVTDNAWTNYTDNNEFTVDIDKLRKDYKNNDIQGFLRIDELDLYELESFCLKWGMKLFLFIVKLVIKI